MQTSLGPSGDIPFSFGMYHRKVSLTGSMKFNGGVGRLCPTSQGRWGSGPLPSGLIEFMILSFRLKYRLEFSKL